MRTIEEAREVIAGLAEQEGHHTFAREVRAGSLTPEMILRAFGIRVDAAIFDVEGPPIVGVRVK